MAEDSAALDLGWRVVGNVLADAFPDDPVLSNRTLQEVKRKSRLYVIFLTPRSGSTWLTELIASAGGMGVPQEWFNPEFVRSRETPLGCRPPYLRGTRDINAYVRSIVDEGQGVAGAEISIFQALMLRELLDGPLDPNVIDATFYLRRRDIVAQAVSLYRSSESGRFHSYQTRPDEIQAFADVKFREDKIIHWIRQILEYERQFDRFFLRCGIRPTLFFYEDLHEDPLAVLNEIAGRMRLPRHRTRPATSLQQMRDHRSFSWCERVLRNLPREVADQIGRRAERLEEIAVPRLSRDAA